MTSQSRPPIQRQRYTVQEVIAAVREAKGIKAAAARLLGCDWYTVHRYAQRYPRVQEAIDQGQDELIDLAGANVARDIMAGNMETSKWLLARRDARFRETRRAEITGADGGPVALTLADLAQRVAEDEERDGDSE